MYWQSTSSSWVVASIFQFSTQAPVRVAWRKSALTALTSVRFAPARLAYCKLASLISARRKLAACRFAPSRYAPRKLAWAKSFPLPVRESIRNSLTRGLANKVLPGRANSNLIACLKIVLLDLLHNFFMV
ncbi:unknown protein [Microcystis aeruginosa NIES-843]|uniref:Uncharacterized protein n=1 Tax=Microcystis aeruginosa (strain NIES-843 / IAM M-2473) TaxID=449447 RepID=B0JMA1_MICAN|nr:unknown protein [Microcystis aeruginosa NIES-843]